MISIQYAISTYQYDRNGIICTFLTFFQCCSDTFQTMLTTQRKYLFTTT